MTEAKIPATVKKTKPYEGGKEGRKENIDESLHEKSSKVCSKASDAVKHGISHATVRNDHRDDGTLSDHMTIMTNIPIKRCLIQNKAVYTGALVADGWAGAENLNKFGTDRRTENWLI